MPNPEEKNGKDRKRMERRIMEDMSRMRGRGMEWTGEEQNGHFFLKQNGFDHLIFKLNVSVDFARTFCTSL